MPGTEHGRPHISLGQNTCRGKQCQQCRNQLASVSVPSPLFPTPPACTLHGSVAISGLAWLYLRRPMHNALTRRSQRLSPLSILQFGHEPEEQRQRHRHRQWQHPTPPASRHASDSDGLIRSGTRARAGTGIGRGTAMGGYCCRRCLHLAVSCHASSLRPPPPLLPADSSCCSAVNCPHSWRPLTDLPNS